MSDARVIRRALENPAVHSVVIRKNQGRESGASQPHLHQQIIGSPGPLPAVLAEARAEREHPGLWHELIEVLDGLKLVIDTTGGIVTYDPETGFNSARRFGYVRDNFTKAGVMATLPGATGILTLRCQQASGRWEEIWQRPHNQTGAA